MRWRRNEYITTAIYKQLNSTVPILPRAYGLPKVHKFNHPFRIIVSSIDSPLYSLAAFLHEIIQKSIPLSFSHISNSFQLIEKLSSVTLEEHYDLLSLDVVSLFTNVPTDLAIEGIKERWSSISLNTQIPLNEFIIGLRLVLNSTFFIFNDTIYKLSVHLWARLCLLSWQT